MAWIAERKDVLSGFFFMLTLGAYVRYSRAPSVTRYTLVLTSLGLGLMAKPMLMTMPFLLLLARLLAAASFRKQPKNANASRLLLEKIPLLVLAVGSAIATSAGATRRPQHGRKGAVELANQ